MTALKFSMKRSTQISRKGNRKRKKKKKTYFAVRPSVGVTIM